MNILQKYLGEIDELELVNRENGHYTNLIRTEDAKEILEKFEIALINEITCEELEKLKLNK